MHCIPKDGYFLKEVVASSSVVEYMPVTIGLKPSTEKGREKGREGGRERGVSCKQITLQ